MIYDHIRHFTYQLPIFPREHYLGYFIRLRELVSNNVKINLHLVNGELLLNQVTSNTQKKVCSFLEIVTRKADIAHHHSLIPFYQKFYTLCLMGDESNYLPKQSMSITNVRYWRWCPLCVQEDKSRGGVSIWHTNHQNPIVNDCDIHHCRLLSHCRKCHFEVRSVMGGISPPANNKCPYCGQLFTADINEKYSINRLWLDDVSKRLLSSNKMIDLNHVKSLVRNEIGVEEVKLHYPPKEKVLMRQARLDFYKACHSQGIKSLFKFNTTFTSFNDPPALFSLTKVAYWEQLLPPIVYLLLMKVFLPEHQINKLLFDR